MFGLNLLQCKNLVDFYVGYNARKDGVGGMSWLFRRMIERLYMIMIERGRGEREKLLAIVGG